MRKIIFLNLLVIFFPFLLISQEIKIGEVNFYEGSSKICREIKGETKCEFVRYGTNFLKGDTVITSEGRVEIDFGNNDFLRIDKNSKVYFDLEKQEPVIDVKKGIIYLTTVSRERYLVKSKRNTVDIGQPGKYRIESGDKTTIFVIKGFAEVTFSDGSFESLNRGEVVEVKNGKILRGFSATYDSFDRFVRKREMVLGIPEKETKELTYYYLPYWYYGRFWEFFYYPTWYVPYNFWLWGWYYPWYGGYYYVPYIPTKGETWRGILTKDSQVYKGGNPPPRSRIRYKLSSPYHSSHGYSSYHGSGSSSYHSTLSKSNISSSSSSSSHSSGRAHPKDK